MLKDDVVNLENLQKEVSSIVEFYELAIQEDDQSLIVDLDSELQILTGKYIAPPIPVVVCAIPVRSGATGAHVYVDQPCREKWTYRYLFQLAAESLKQFSELLGMQADHADKHQQSNHFDQQIPIPSQLFLGGHARVNARMYQAG